MDNQLLWHNFYQEINRPDKEIDLATASLYFSQAEYPDLDVREYLNILDAIASEIEPQLPAELYPLKVIKTINYHLFDRLGFQGNQEDYYEPENSFLNRVIDYKTGIPITLSVVYLAIAQRLNFPMVGIGMPGHFLIRPEFEEAGIFVDPFNRGEILFQQDCQEKLQEIYQQQIELKPKLLAPVSNKQILARMLNNLKFIYLHRRELDKALGTMSGIIKIFPENAMEIRDRGLLYYQSKRWREAIVDLEYFLKIAPHSEDAPMIKVLLDKMNRVS
ncbi:transglutaminase family protein [Pleurocapsales cyanobacterium LEGE 10410]|nr:transglutaminase family protein [Pleurocapsales cyanobacterium LEGE 10410]